MFSSPVAEMMSVLLPSRKQQVAENTLLKVDWMMIDDKNDVQCNMHFNYGMVMV